MSDTQKPAGSDKSESQPAEAKPKPDVKAPGSSFQQRGVEKNG